LSGLVQQGCCSGGRGNQRKAAAALRAHGNLQYS
jgi:hypothetical protein